jgi:hypothetical protein
MCYLLLQGKVYKLSTHFYKTKTVQSLPTDGETSICHSIAALINKQSLASFLYFYGDTDDTLQLSTSFEIYFVPYLYPVISQLTHKTPFKTIMEANIIKYKYNG